MAQKYLIPDHTGLAITRKLIAPVMTILYSLKGHPHISSEVASHVERMRGVVMRGTIAGRQTDFLRDKLYDDFRARSNCNQDERT